MARIFFTLALVAFALLITNLVLGFAIGDLNQDVEQWLKANREVRELSPRRSEVPDEFKAAQQRLHAAKRQLDPVRRRNVVHTLLGVAGALVTVLVNSISVTYFIGTSRWCREVVEAYHLPEELAQRSARLKTKTFPWSLIGILSILVMIGLGAACDPTVNLKSGAGYVTPHMLASIIGTLVIACAFGSQVVNIGANYEVIERILKLVQEARGE